MLLYDVAPQDILCKTGESRLSREVRLPRTPTPPYKCTGRKLWSKIHLANAPVVGLDPALVGLTGSLLVFYKAIDAWLNPGLLTTNGRGPRASIDDIFAEVRTAAGAFPNVESTSIDLTSTGPEGVYAVRMRQPGEVRKPGGATVVWVDQHRGDLLHRRGPRAMSAGDTFLLWQHNGGAFGLPGRLIILLSGLSLPLLYVTGLWIWWRRRRGRRRARHRER